MDNERQSNSYLQDKSSEVENSSRFLVIKSEPYFNGRLYHPLVNGNPPNWAEVWGDTHKYGPFIEVGSLRFLWHPDLNFWFCEVTDDKMLLSDEKMREIGAAILSDELEINQIKNYDGYKKRVHELDEGQQLKIIESGESKTRL